MSVDKINSDSLAYIAAKFAELFEGQGSDPVARAEDALCRAKQIMSNMAPLISQAAKQLPRYTAENLPAGWKAKSLTGNPHDGQ